MRASGPTVRVPATSANIGPGFDSLGLALGIVDEVQAAFVDEPGVRVEVLGEGVGEVPTGADHLLVRALHAALADLGCAAPGGLHVRCRNAVPHGRGLGSSAAAVVAGVLLGRALAGAETSEGVASDDAVLRVATRLEGHPDNAAAALLGGASIAWVQDGEPHAVRFEVDERVVPLVLLPAGRLATHHARSVLPASVSHEDAAANVARAALLVRALGADPRLLFAATEDRMHQRQRRAAMPATLGLVDQLRDAGLAAVVSGAGPAVLVLSTRDRSASDIGVVRAAVSTASTASGAAGRWTVLTPGLWPARAMAVAGSVTASSGVS